MQQLTDVMGNNFTRDVLQVTKDELESTSPSKKSRILKHVSTVIHRYNIFMFFLKFKKRISKLL